jgi:ribosomal protein L11 methyltransferase
VIRLAVRVACEHAELVLAELLELAPAGVEEVRLDEARIEYAVYGAPGELPALPDLWALAGGAPVEVSTSEIADDWQERWKDFHRPVLIPRPAAGAHLAAVPALLVRPPWEPGTTRAGAPTLELVVDPGQAFGTGGHASTRLCLALLLELAARDGAAGRALDVGTGSGVLAMAAAKLGFGPLLALDNESESVEAAAANATVNGVELEARLFDLREEPLPWLGASSAPQRTGATSERVLLLANLLRPLLLILSRAIELPPEHLIAGGLLVGQLDEVAESFRARTGLIERARREEGEWGALWLARERTPRRDSGPEGRR